MKTIDLRYILRIAEKTVDGFQGVCYSRTAWKQVFFLCLNLRYKKTHNEIMEVEVVRTKITLACTECQQRNYNMTKDKKAHPDRMETKKYCRFCRKHTLHKETK